MIVTFIPAAGRSSRMRGADKLLEPVKGQPILRRVAETALAADLGPVIVGLPPKDRARRKALRNLPVQIVEVPDADTGMSATLRAGATAASAEIDKARPSGGDGEYFGMLVLLPDMPGIQADDLRLMSETFRSQGGSTVRAVGSDGRPGHPVLFPDHVLGSFEDLKDDKGAAALLEQERVFELELPGDRATRDLDTPEDWAKWRIETGIKS